MSFDNLTLEVAGEFGSFSGSREYFGTDGYSFRRLGKVDGLDRNLVNAFYWRKWRAENPERAQAYVAAYMARDPARKRAMRQARKRRYQQKNRDRYNAQQRASYARRVGKVS